MASVITIAFENWKAQEAATGTAVLLDEFVFAYVPNLDPTKPIDRNEKLPTSNQIVHRQKVNKAGLASENAVAYSITLGADVGNFDFNWIGLLNKESGTVAMITHAPAQKKLKTENGQQGNVLTRSFLLEFQGAAVETQIKTTAETWQIDFTARLSGIDEMQRLVNLDNYGSAAFFNDGFEVTRSSEQFTVKKGAGYVGGLRGELLKNEILNGLRNTKIYADFSYQGNIVSQWTTVIKITAASSLTNYVDAAGFTHQVFAIASIDGSGNVKDLRPKSPVGELKDDLSEFAKIDTIYAAGIIGDTRNARMSIVSESSIATLTADEVIVATALGGVQYRIGNFNKSISLASVGAGGMDTGIVPSAGFVALYAIYNPTTGESALLATDATNSIAPEVYGGAAMPAGYTASALVSVWKTSISKFGVGFQMGRKINLLGISVLSTSGGSSEKRELDISSAVPMNCKSINIGGNVDMIIGEMNAIYFEIYGSFYAVNGRRIAVTSTGIWGDFSDVLLENPQKVYYRYGPKGARLVLVVTAYSI